MNKEEEEKKKGEGKRREREEGGRGREGGMGRGREGGSYHQGSAFQFHIDQVHLPPMSMIVVQMHPAKILTK